jgi:ribosome-associated heat shock protein Hsp15
MSDAQGESAGSPLSPASGRLDRWLWFARVVKSRTLAAGLVEEGKVRINRSKVAKPSHAVRVGDVLTIRVGPRVRVLKVAQIGERRGPAVEAQRLYQELAPEPEGGAAMHSRPPGEREPGSGRPTKRERRQIGHFKGG